MTDFRFDSLMNVKTPDSWVDRAVGLPRRRRKPLSLSTMYLIAAAASLVFITALSVFLYLTAGQTPETALPVQTVSESTTPTFTTPDGGVYVTTPQGETQPVTDADGQPVTLSRDVGGSTAFDPLPSGTICPTAPRHTTAPTNQTEPSEKPSSALPLPTGTAEPTDAPSTREEPPEPCTEEPPTEEPWIEKPSTEEPCTEAPETEADPPTSSYYQGRVVYIDDGTFQNVNSLRCRVSGADATRVFFMPRVYGTSDRFHFAVPNSSRLPRGVYTLTLTGERGVTKTIQNVSLFDGDVTIS